MSSHVTKHKRMCMALNAERCLNHGNRHSTTASSQPQDTNPEETKAPWT